MPMPPDPPLDALGQATDEAVVERRYLIAGFARLQDRLARTDGTAEVRLEFGMIDGMPAGVLRLRAGVVLVCQRCLRPMRRELTSNSRLVFVPRDDVQLPADHEALVGDPRRVDLAALVEDELLLALPLTAHHAPAEECKLPAEVQEAPTPAPEMRRPFAGLKDLLKH